MVLGYKIFPEPFDASFRKKIRAAIFHLGNGKRESGVQILNAPSPRNETILDAFVFS
jgi:hypothetical protein